MNYFSAAVRRSFFILLFLNLQACRSREIVRVPDAGKATVSPLAKSLSQYFSPSAPLMRARAHKNAGNLSAEWSQSVIPDCVQYNALLGKGSGAGFSCNFIQDWTGAQGIEAKMNACKPSVGKYLLVDLVTDFKSSSLYAADDKSPLVNVEHGVPFMLLTYCVDATNGTVDVYNPEHVAFQIRSTTTYSTVEKVVEYPGWFLGSFNDFENGSLSTKYAVAELVPIQGAVNLTTNLGTKIPRVRIQVRPVSYTAEDPQFKMGRYHTDNMQTMVRDPIVHGMVNPSNGELAFTHTDLEYPAVDSDKDLSIERSFRSNFNRVGDFGYYWDMFPRVQYLSFMTPTQDQGTYKFLSTGESRFLFVPETSNGIFWGADPADNSQTPRDNPLQPDRTKINWLPGMQRSLFDLNGRSISFEQRYNHNMQYYLRDGSNVVMVMDMIGARNTAATIQSIVTVFKAAEDKLKAGQYTTARSLIVDATTGILKKAGNFIWFVRNDKGFVSWTIDKSGFANQYKYSSTASDFLESVIRHVMHDPDGDGTETYETLELYHYNWQSAPTESDSKNWPKTLSSASTYESANWLQNLTYTLPTDLYGEAPVVTSFKDLEGTTNIAYAFSFTTPTTNSVTTVTDALGRVFKYTFDWRGFVNKVEGPTEAQASAVLQQRLLDPHLLTVVDEIQRGVETYRTYDSNGDLATAVECGDRSAGSQAQIVATLGTLNADKNPTGVSCEGSASRTTAYFAGQNYQKDWFVDLTAVKVPTSYALPTTTLNAGTSRIFSVTKWDCFGNPGTMRYSPTNRESGTECVLTSDTKGGNWLKLKLVKQAEDGSVLQSLTTEAVEQMTYSSTPDSRVLLGQNHPAGHVMNASALGYDWVSGTSLGSSPFLTSTSLKRRDPYSNIVYEQSPTLTTSFKRNFFNYLLPSANLGTQQIVREAGSLPASTLTGATAYNLFSGGLTIGGQSALPLSGRLVGFTSASGKNLWPVFKGYSATPRNPMKPSWTINESGAVQEYTYVNNGTPLIASIRTREASDSSGAYLQFDTTYSYDAYNRPTGSVKSNGTSNTIIYRTTNDKGIWKTESDSQSIKGVKSTSEIVAWDWAGRKLHETITRVIPTSDHGDPVSALPTTEDITYEYSPYGEITLESKTLSTGQVFQKAMTYDLPSGVLVSKSLTSTGTHVSARTETTEYSDFNSYLRPQKTKDIGRNIEVSMTGVPGIHTTKTVKGPATYRAGGALQVYSKTEEFFDGCGNKTLSRVYSTDTVYTTQSNSVMYVNGLCLVDYATDESGKKTYFAYDAWGEKFISDPSYDWQNQSAENLANDLTAQYSFARTVHSGTYDTYGHPSSLVATGIAPTLVPVVDVVSVAGGNGVAASGASAFIIHGGQASYLNHRGRQLTGYDQNDTFTTSFAGTPLDLNTEDNSRGFSTVNNYTKHFASGPTEWTKDLTAQNASTLKGFVRQDLDSGFKEVKRVERRRKDPAGGSDQISLQKMTFDELGHQTGASIYESSVAIDTTPGFWSPTSASLKTLQSVNTWNQDRPAQSTLVNTTPAGAVTDTVQNTSFGSDGLFESPTVTSFSRTRVSPSVTSTGSKNVSFDGMQRPVQTSFTDAPDNAFGNLSLTSTVTSAFDYKSRITSQVMELDDYFNAGVPSNKQSFAVGSYTLQRDRLSGGAQDFSVTYSYPNNRPQDIVLSFDGFTVTYTYSLGSSSLLSVKVNTPAGNTITYNTYGLLKYNGASFAPQLDQYLGSVDRSAGQVMAPLGNSALSRQDMFAAGGVFTLNNAPVPPFLLAPTGGNGTGVPETGFQSVPFDMDTSGNITDIRWSSPPAGTWLGELKTSSWTIDKTRSARASTNYNCDNVAGLSVVAGNNQSSSLWQSQGSTFNGESDRITQMNVLGKLSHIRRAQYAGTSGSPRIYKFFSEAYNSYDAHQQVAAKDEVLWYQNTDAATGNYFKDAPKVARAISHRYWNMSVPDPKLFGGRIAFPFKEVVLDPGHATNYLSSGQYDSNDQGWGNQASVNGTKYHIPGPMGSPIMTFQTNANGGYDLYLYHYDSQGNVKNFYLSVPLVSNFAPQYNEMYLPHLSSIVSKYSNVGYNDSINQYETQSSAGAMVYYPSNSPALFPRPTGFGAAGSIRDIAGIVYMNGEAYSTNEGTFIRDGYEDDNTVCATPSAALLRSQATFAEKWRRQQFMPSDPTANPTIQMRTQEAQAYLDHIENIPSFWTHPFTNLSRRVEVADQRPYAEQFFANRNTKQMMLQHTSGIPKAGVLQEWFFATESFYLGWTDWVQAVDHGGAGEIALTSLALTPVLGWGIKGLRGGNRVLKGMRAAARAAAMTAEELRELERLAAVRMTMPSRRVPSAKSHIYNWMSEIAKHDFDLSSHGEISHEATGGPGAFIAIFDEHDAEALGDVTSALEDARGAFHPKRATDAGDFVDITMHMHSSMDADSRIAEINRVVSHEMGGHFLGGYSGTWMGNRLKRLHRVVDIFDDIKVNEKMMGNMTQEVFSEYARKVKRILKKPTNLAARMLDEARAQAMVGYEGSLDTLRDALTTINRADPVRDRAKIKVGLSVIQQTLYDLEYVDFGWGDDLIEANVIEEAYQWHKRTMGVQ